MKDDEILLEGYDDDENPRKAFIRKLVIRGVAIILILLMASYLLAFYAVGYVSSQAESAPREIPTFVFNDDGKKIVFVESVYEELQKIYFDNREHEFKVCLFGTIEGNEYAVDKLTEPEIFSQSPFHVSAELCPREAIIDLHGHPFQKCIASAADIAYLENLQTANAKALIAIMCEQDRMSFYG